jgi:hypothetical protein
MELPGLWVRASIHNSLKKTVSKRCEVLADWRRNQNGARKETAMSSEWEEIERHWEGDPNLCRVCGPNDPGMADVMSFPRIDHSLIYRAFCIARLRKIEDYGRAHLAESISIEMLAEFSPKWETDIHLNRLFRSA